MNKEYSKEYKLRAVKMVMEQGYTPSKASRALGIPNLTLCSWLEKAGWKSPEKEPLVPLSSDPVALQIKVRELEAQVKRLELEKEILKKATAFFANQNP